MWILTTEKTLINSEQLVQITVSDTMVYGGLPDSFRALTPQMQEKGEPIIASCHDKEEASAVFTMMNIMLSQSAASFDVPMMLANRRANLEAIDL